MSEIMQAVDSLRMARNDSRKRLALMSLARAVYVHRGAIETGDAMALRDVIAPLNEMMEKDGTLRLTAIRVVAALSYRWIGDSSSLPILDKFSLAEDKRISEAATLALYRLDYVAGRSLPGERTSGCLTSTRSGGWMTLPGRCGSRRARRDEPINRPASDRLLSTSKLATGMPV